MNNVKIERKFKVEKVPNDLEKYEKQEKVKRLHYMKLQPKPFHQIKNGSKEIEMRLYDEKRQKIKVGDRIKFTNIENGETIETTVEKLYVFSSFKELYQKIPTIKLGYQIGEKADPDDMKQYYLEEEIQKFGVVGIKIKK